MAVLGHMWHEYGVHRVTAIERDRTAGLSADTRSGGQPRIQAPHQPNLVSVCIRFDGPARHDLVRRDFTRTSTGSSSILAATILAGVPTALLPQEPAVDEPERPSKTASARRREVGGRRFRDGPYIGATTTEDP
jgi:hypothetical protein